MMRLHLLSSIAVVVCFLQLTSGDNCKMADFPVKANFEPDRFAGKWYEIKWIIEPWIPPEWNYLDYFQNFTLIGSDFDIFSLGRVSSSKDYCDPGTSALYATGENAKYIYNRKYNSTARLNSTYWITDTDYDNYALAYGCRELVENGTCVQPDCWLWSRRPTLEDSYLKTMEDQLPGICLSVDMLLVTLQEKECTAKVLSSTNTANHAAAVGAAWVVTVALLAAVFRIIL